ncbi:MAG: hypothetical protein AAFY26_09960 [Cyanobacteria bacterium J06638_22]
MSNENTTRQIELVARLLSSQEERAKFLIDSDAYFDALAYEVDESLKRSLRQALLEVEAQFAQVGEANPFIEDSSTPSDTTEQGITEITMNVVAVASVVSAAAAVVSAAAAVTSATSASSTASSSSSASTSAANN